MGDKGKKKEAAKEEAAKEAPKEGTTKEAPKEGATAPKAKEEAKAAEAPKALSQLDLELDTILSKKFQAFFQKNRNGQEKG